MEKACRSSLQIQSKLQIFLVGRYRNILESNVHAVAVERSLAFTGFLFEGDVDIEGPG